MNTVRNNKNVAYTVIPATIKNMPLTITVIYTTDVISKSYIYFTLYNYGYNIIMFTVEAKSHVQWRIIYG